MFIVERKRSTFLIFEGISERGCSYGTTGA
nr:MAG TPA_asm: hypothetical protein [Caudoviricetes sp.]